MYPITDVTVQMLLSRLIDQFVRLAAPVPELVRRLQITLAARRTVIVKISRFLGSNVTRISFISLQMDRRHESSSAHRAKDSVQDTT